MDPSVFEKTVPFEPDVRLRLLTGARPFFGPGVAELLTRIQATGSVSAACERMGLSYSKGRTMLRRMDAALGFVTVERAQGGAGGGGARLTRRGKALLTAYAAFERDVSGYARSRFTAAFGAFADGRAQEEEQP